MEFKQLEAFVRVADCLSFSKAAEQLYLTQPTVSQHIAELERELKGKLFERTTRSLTLTEYGSRVYPYAMRVIELRDRMIDRSVAEDDANMVIGASSIPATYMIPAITGKLFEADQNAKFRIIQGNSREIEDMVVNGAVDVGIVGRECDTQDVYSEKLCEDELVLTTPATSDYRELVENRDYGTLLTRPIILREEGSGTQKAADILLQSDHPGHELNVIARCNDQESIKHMVTAGMGVSIMSHMAARRLEQAGQMYCLPLSDASERSFYVVCKKTMSDNVHVKRFTTVAKKLFG